MKLPGKPVHTNALDGVDLGGGWTIAADYAVVTGEGAMVLLDVLILVSPNGKCHWPWFPRQRRPVLEYFN